MKSGRAALRYAKALLDYSLESQKENNVFEEMQEIQSVMENNPALAQALNNPVLPSKQKRQLMDEIFKERSKITISLFDLLSQNNREGILEAVAYQYIVLFNKHQGKVSATVTTAVPLDKVLEEQVLQKAAELSPLKIELKNIVDPTIKGGFILRVGDLQYNASVAERMKTLKRELITS
ncbi:MAG: ATP synthase F1 subunit delta [Flavobacteriales bacterium MED-G15]|nr:MAG: ATP synthase F1 subunit delta [Flavobacteriales bacterium MED-G15]|tara:strand:- start:54 stop:590 length:537 start_codon:yes stop_codon:yes gene_type:complete